MKILLVEDNGYQSETFKSHLERQGHTVVEATDGSRAAQTLFPKSERDLTIDAVITDMKMEPQTGLFLLQYMHHSRSTIPCLLHSSEATFRQNGQDLELVMIPQIFSFAEFHLKDADMSYIDTFLSGIAR